MKQTFWLFVAVIFLFGVAVVQVAGASAKVVKIDCSDAGSISFVIQTPDVAEWAGSADNHSWSLNKVNDEACKPTFDTHHGLVKYSNINASICDPGDPSLTPPDNSTFEYEFEISAAAKNASNTSVTFAYDHYYVVKCFYNREKKNIMASFEPHHSLRSNGSAVNDFKIKFTLHDARTHAALDGVIDLRKSAYGKLNITGSAGFPQGLDVHLRKVSVSADRKGVTSVTLVTDGCAVTPIITSTTCNTDADDKFYFDVFRFPSQSGHDKVFFSATVIVCLADDKSSVCKRECAVCPKKRSVRETLEEIQQTEFYVTAGPFQIRGLDQESQAAAAAAGKDDGTPLPSYGIAVVAVGALLAVAIVSAVVLIVFRRRRQNIATFELQKEDSTTA